MEKIESINFLNLELNNTQKILVKIKEYNLICNFNNNYSHDLHGSNSQLNSLVDLIINLGKNLKTSQFNFHKEIEDLKNRKTKITNLDYIKDQNSVILDILSQI